MMAAIGRVHRSSKQLCHAILVTGPYRMTVLLERNMNLNIYTTTRFSYSLVQS